MLKKIQKCYINSEKAVNENIRALNDEMGIRIDDAGEIVKILNN